MSESEAEVGHSLGKGSNLGKAVRELEQLPAGVGPHGIGGVST